VYLASPCGSDWQPAWGVWPRRGAGGRRGDRRCA